MFLADPGSGFFPIPDPGVNKHWIPDPDPHLWFSFKVLKPPLVYTLVFVKNISGHMATFRIFRAMLLVGKRPASNMDGYGYGGKFVL
jgi:hypothetical protein